MKKIFLVLGLSLSAHLLSAQTTGDADNGKKLFSARCAACHNFKQKLVGPNLRDVHKKRTEAWIIKFVQNSQAMIKAKDPQAVAIFKEYHQSVMPPHPDLTSAKIKDIIAYIKVQSAKPAAGKK